MDDISASAQSLNAEPGDALGRRISLLGATGSIGRNTLDLIERHPEAYDIVAVTARTNVEKLAATALSTGAEVAVIVDETRYDELKQRLAGSSIEALCGVEGLVEAAGRPADLVVAAIIGFAGLKPTLAAVDQGATIALANKECLVAAGSLFTDRAEAAGARLLPVDSEHNAVFQAIADNDEASIAEILLTASGGPFRTFSYEEMKGVTPAQALKHPNWSMGAKITIDSATLMNKGLEVIEAAHLFPVGADRLGAIVHPQSIVHGLVRYIDGSVLAQLGPHDMRGPLSYCLNWPRRAPTPCDRLDLATLGSLTFEPVDVDRFPAFGLALAAMAAGPGMPIVLNAANEVAVEAFLQERSGFTDIAKLVERTMNRAEASGMVETPADIADVFAIDEWARNQAAALVNHF
ncbi:MAG: 1-deoxy-D-xylulose-5-phosphate reductoisomerase [Pseudomonadota bacterium]